MLGDLNEVNDRDKYWIIWNCYILINQAIAKIDRRTYGRTESSNGWSKSLTYDINYPHAVVSAGWITRSMSNVPNVWGLLLTGSMIYYIISTTYSKWSSLVTSIRALYPLSYLSNSGNPIHLDKRLWLGDSWNYRVKFWYINLSTTTLPGCSHSSVDRHFKGFPKYRVSATR